MLPPLLAALLTLSAAPAHRTVLFHKPAGVVTSHVAQHELPTAFDCLRAELPPPLAALPWRACGRLDLHTSGALVVTTDGALVHHVTEGGARGGARGGAGRARVEKEYLALCQGALDELQLAALRAGVELGGGLGVSRRARVERLDGGGSAGAAASPWPDGARGHPTTTLLRVVLDEGKNRQVRRMLAAVGSGVLRLQRARVGALTLRGVEAERAWRLLDDDEVRDALGYDARAAAAARAPRARARRPPRDSRSGRIRDYD